MFIQSISNSSLNTFNKPKINFSSINTNQNVYKSTTLKNDNDKKEFTKKELKKTYWKGVLSGVLFSLLVIGGDYLCEYLIEKSSPKLRK